MSNPNIKNFVNGSIGNFYHQGNLTNNEIRNDLREAILNQLIDKHSNKIIKNVDVNEVVVELVFGSGWKRDKLWEVNGRELDVENDVDEQELYDYLMAEGKTFVKQFTNDKGMLTSPEEYLENLRPSIAEEVNRLFISNEVPRTDNGLQKDFMRYFEENMSNKYGNLIPKEDIEGIFNKELNNKIEELKVPFELKASLSVEHARIDYNKDTGVVEYCEIESAPPLTAKTVMGSAPDKIEISLEMEM